MDPLIPVLTSIGLLDAISITPLAIVPLLATLGARRPARRTTALLAGLFVPYYAFGVAIALGLSSLFDAATRHFDRWLYDPDALDIALQIAIGAVALALGMKLARSRENPDDRGAADAGGGLEAFSIGATLTVVGLPGALPYFAAIDQLLRADLGPAASFGALAYYNLVCAAPLIAVALVRALLGARSDAFFARLAALVGRLSHRLIVGGLLLLGLVLVVDGVAWMHGHPLIEL